MSPNGVVSPKPSFTEFSAVWAYNPKHGSGAGESRHDPLATAQDRGFDHRQRAPGVCPVGQRVCLEGAL
jgi:hypothetical protein